MSGCHNPYIDMPVCEHLVPLKFTCGRCEVSKMTNDYVSFDVIHTMRQTIETWQKGCEILINVLQERIHLLEEHKNRQIDENRKVSKRIDELESISNSQANTIKILCKKSNKADKQPYSCPICDGKGFDKKEGLLKYTCRSCKGSCVLWG